MIRELLPLSTRALRERMDAGFAFDPAALDDTEYHGVSLGLPELVERMAWKTFKKVFRRDPADGVLRGWNVAVAQQGPDGPWEDRLRRGKRVTYGHYQVWPASSYVLPGPWGSGAVIDYGKGGNALFDPTGLTIDPLVALEEGSAEWLLGFSMLQFGPLQWSTPSWFVLHRGGPLTYDVRPPRGRG